MRRRYLILGVVAFCALLVPIAQGVIRATAPVVLQPGTYVVPTNRTVTQTVTGPTTTVTQTQTVTSTVTVTDPGTTTTAPTTTTTPTTTSSSSEPTPIAGQGYQVAFQDDFNALDSSVWNDHIWYQSSPPAGAVTTSNGVLTLQSTQAAGWKQINVATDQKKTWQYGYFEARLKWTGVQGAWPAFWLFSEAHRDGTQGTLGTSEVDIQEGDGNYPNGYNTALHRDTGGNDAYCPSNNFHADLGQGDLTVGWHTYGLLWTATQVTWYLDGQQIATCAPYANSTDQPMFMLLSMWPGGAASGSTPPQSVTSIETDVDWVRVWQKP